MSLNSLSSFQSFDDFIQHPDLSTSLQQKNAFVSVQGNQWQIVTLTSKQVLLRKIFGCFRDTHHTQVINALKKSLQTKVFFDDSVQNIKKMLLVAQNVFQLQSVEEEIDVNEIHDSSKDTDAAINKLCLQSFDKQRFIKTQHYLVQNRDLFEEMQKQEIAFKIRSNKNHRLGIRVTKENFFILGKKTIGHGGFKQIRTAYDVQNNTCLAIARMLIGNPKVNRLVRFFRKRLARNEIKALENVKGKEGCIQLKSSFFYQGKNQQNKAMILMDLADQDLSRLIKKPLTVEEKLDLASQLIDILVLLSKDKIWHRDIKPQNFLCFKENGKNRIVMADFGLATHDRDLFAQKIIGGTPIYMAPENRRFFRLFNGKKGDVYSMGVTLSDFIKPEDNLPFLDTLIEDMQILDPSKRPSAEEVKTRFQQGLEEYIEKK